MRIIAIDPGYDRMGVAILEKLDGDKEKIIFSTCIETSGETEFADRLLSIGESVENLIVDYSPIAMAIEDLFFAKNTKTALRVASARGSIIYIAKKNNIPVYEYKPNEIKIAVTGYGNANKSEIQEFIPKIIKIEKEKMLDDEIDAIAVGLTFFAREKFYKD